TLWRIAKRLQRILHFLAADQIDHKTRLLRRQTNVPCERMRFNLRILCLNVSHVYAFGAGAAGAAPPPAAGAAPAAFSRAAFTAWPLNVRVGANSPSLCPIICSVTYTGINFLPLCTAIVCPIISGTMVERRDHVFTTFFSFRAFSPSTLSRRWPSTNGPFFNERAIGSLFL